MLTDDCMQVSLQQGHIAALQAENTKLKREKTALQQDFDEYRHTAERRAERTGGRRPSVVTSDPSGLRLRVHSSLARAVVGTYASGGPVARRPPTESPDSDGSGVWSARTRL